MIDKKLVTDAWGCNTLVEALKAIKSAAMAWESAAVKVGKVADAIRKRAERMEG